MRRCARLLVVLSMAWLPAVAACVSENPLPVVPDIDEGILEPDSGAPPSCFNTTGICPDAAGVNATVPADAGIDSTLPDGNEPDTTAADTNQPDTSAPNTSPPDANVLDTSAPDSNVPDTSVEDTGVTSLPVNAGPDVLDAGPDVFDAGPDVFDAGPPQCAVDVVGDYYIRASGTLAYYNGTTTEVLVEATGQPLEPVAQVFIEPYGACALRSSDQTVWCWATFSSSNNTDGELGNGTLTDVTTTFSATQVEISAPDGGPPVYLDNVTSLASGSTAAAIGIAFSGICAIRSDKSLWCWGPATQGNLWEGTTGSTADLVFATQMKVTTDGGAADGGAAYQNVDQVSMGGRHACFLSAGSVYCWGDNTSGELGTGDTTDQINPFQVTSGLPSVATSVSAGEDQSCVLAGGQVYCWGADTYSSNGDPFVAHQICNSNYCQPLPVPVQVALPDGGSNEAPLTGIQTLHGGDAFSCAVDGTGTPYCWGQATGSPLIVQEATLFVNPSGPPSGPIAHLTSLGGDYGTAPTSLRYITTSGVLVSGSVVVSQVCP